MSDLAIGRSGTGRHIAYVLRSNPVTAVATAGALVLVFVAIFAPVLVPYDPLASNVPIALQAALGRPLGRHRPAGRDIFSRILAATRLDLMIAFSAVSLSFAVGAGDRRLLRLCRRRARIAGSAASSTC